KNGGPRCVAQRAAPPGRGDRPERPPLGDSDRTPCGERMDYVHRVSSESVRPGPSLHDLARPARDDRGETSRKPSAAAPALPTAAADAAAATPTSDRAGSCGSPAIRGLGGFVSVAGDRALSARSRTEIGASAAALVHAELD